MERRSWRHTLLLGTLLCLPLTGRVASATETPTVSQQVQWATADTGVRLTLRFPQPDAEDIDGQRIYRIENEGLIGEAGSPDLPLVNRLVRIPDRSDVSLNILAEDWQPLDPVRVRPMQERLHTEADLPLSWLESPAIYGMDGWWPLQAVSISEPMILRDQRVIQLSVAPLRWNPANGALEELVTLDLSLDFHGQNPVNQITAPMPHSPLMAELVGDALISPPPAEGTLREIEWHTAERPLNYLVFTPGTALQNVRFQDWIDWKFRKGHHMTIVTDGDISWNSTAIRNTIISEYGGEYPPDYVTLVGDPDGGSYVTPTNGSQYDHAYAAIAGNDILADVVVGRISARSSTQLSTIFNKILAYEQDPDLANPGWLHRASFLTGQGHCGLSMSQLSRGAAFSLVDNFGYTQIDTAFCAASPSYVSTWYNAGTSYYNYRGWIGMEGLNTTTIQNLTQGRRTPVTVIFTCSSGDFASGGDPAYTEAFLRAGNAVTPGGGVAAMGFCTSQTHTAYNNVVCGGFWYAILDQGIRQVGTAMFRGKYELFRSLPPGDSNISNFSYWANLMGDPGMNMWVGEPDVLQISEAPATLSAGDTRLALRVTTTGDQPVENTVVCASQPDGFQVLGLTGPDGRVVLTLPVLDEASPLWITASHDDCVPAMQDISLTSASATPSLGSLEYDSDGNAWALPGTVTSLDMRVSNPTASTLSGASLTLSLEPGVGTIQVASAALPSIAPGQSANLLSSLQFTVDGDVSGDAPVWLDLTLAWDGGNSVSHRVLADVRTPRLELSNPNVSGLNLMPGTTSNLQVEILNSGNLAGNNLSLVASFPQESRFTTPGTPVTLSLPAGGGSDQLFVPVTVDAEAYAGNNTMLDIAWTSPLGMGGSFSVPVRCGAGVQSEPSGPDAYGYYAWEDSDAGEMSMAYGWIEIAPAAGGTGTVLNLTDTADEADDAAMVTLPFDFTLYGVTYSEMSVCSNGFVSFGPDSHLETDFRNHYLPGAMGPQPMLAVMWDDHKLTGGAQVCVEYLPSSHMVVVEWYRVRGNSQGVPNTFQLLLLDPAVYQTPTGDGDFVYQYHTFIDDQNNSQDFPYCTIGVEDHTGTRGMTFTNYDHWDATATPITGTRSIRFTTLQQAPVGGVLEVLSPSLNYTLSSTEAMQETDSLRLGNSGTGLISWNARIEVEGDWPPSPAGLLRLAASRDTGGPDSFGYRWIDSDEDSGPEVNWVAPGDDAIAVDFEQNDAAAGPFEIGFDFSYYGQLFSSLYISPNGFISFTDNANYWNNAIGVPNDLAPDNAICGWWDDLLQEADLNGHVFRSHSADSLVVSWVDTPHYNPGQFGGPFTFQIILESNGSITLQYGEMTSGNPLSDSGTMGLQGPSAEEGFAIRHMLISRSDYAVRISPPFWLELSTSGGLLGAQQTTAVPVVARNEPSGLLLPEGVWNARIVVESGDQSFDVPVTLTIAEVGVGGDPNANPYPTDFSLGRVWPNPFNPTTTVELGIPDSRPVRLRLYNLQGQLVRTLLEGSQAPGTLQLTLDASALASGVYLLSLEGDGFQQTRKIALVR